MSGSISFKSTLNGLPRVAFEVVSLFQHGGNSIMDFLVVAIPWLLIGAAGGNYRMKKKREVGLEPSREGEIMIFALDTLFGPLTWFFMFRP
jgi:hypothetical protein